MLVGDWAEKYWESSTITKKTLYGYRNVFGRVISSQIGRLELDFVSQIGGKHTFPKTWLLRFRGFESRGLSE
jgi:hypothetical protein